MATRYRIMINKPVKMSPGALLILCSVLFAHLSFGQNIVFVTPNMAGKDQNSIDISNQLKSKVQENIGLVKYTYEYTNFMLRTPANIDRLKRKIRDLNIKYVLKGEDISKLELNKYLVTFSFSEIDEELNETPVEWINPEYIVEKQVGKAPANIDEVFNDINTEISFYLANKTSIGEFRPRIFIDREKFSPPDAEDKIQFDIFCDWLEETLNDTSEIKKYRFNYYDADKEIYPDSASILLYGEFKPETSQGETIDVFLVVKMGSKTRKENPPVTIWISDFTNETFENEMDYKPTIISDINDLLNRLIR